eukprot:TRINITY_DN6150_c0_g2_i4.p1 TRINITY_DN6150_c0_g2~~TRINITY_DN6150_c0_g2_i4.p1  ORF type:complete len:459 (+),score=87.05 TRINITY_DN6150_c0_g2_i4:63-1439(+)
MSSKRNRWGVKPADTVDVAPQPPPVDAKQAAVFAAQRLREKLAKSGKLGVSSAVNPQQPDASTTDANNTAQAVTTRDIEINDNPRRGMVTKKAVQEEIAKATGCAITTRGQYITPQQRGYTHAKPLHLHLEAIQPQAVAEAEKRIKDLLFPSKHDPVAVAKQLASSLTNRYVGMAPETYAFNAELLLPSERLPGFDVVQRVVGPNSSYLQHIERQTGARVVLKHLANASCLVVSHADRSGHAQALQLAQDLINTVQGQLASHKAMVQQSMAHPPPPPGMPIPMGRLPPHSMMARPPMPHMSGPPMHRPPFPGHSMAPPMVPPPGAFPHLGGGGPPPPLPPMSAPGHTQQQQEKSLEDGRLLPLPGGHVDTTKNKARKRRFQEAGPSESPAPASGASTQASVAEGSALDTPSSEQPSTKAAKADKMDGTTSEQGSRVSVEDASVLSTGLIAYGSSDEDE